MSIYNTILKKSGAYGISVLIARMAGFLLLPVYTRFLSPADYGLLALSQLSVDVFGTLIGIRLGDALCYYSSKHNEPEIRRRITATAVSGSLLIGAVGIGAIAASPLPKLASILVFQSSNYSILFRLALLNVGLGIVVDTGLSYLRAENQARRYATISIIRLILAAVLNVVFLAVWRFGVSSILWGSLLATTVIAAYLPIHIFRQTGFQVDFRMLRQQYCYAAPLSLSGLLMFVLHYGDRFFLQRYVSMAQIGVYSMAYQFGMIVSLMQSPFSLYWSSQMFDVARGPGGDRAYVRIATYVLTILSLTATLISLFIGPVLKIMVGKEYQSAAVYVPWIALAYVLRAFADQIRSVFSINKKTLLFVNTNLVGAGACLVGYATLIPRFGAWGAVWATLLGFIVLAVYSLWTAQRVQYYPLELDRMVRVLLCSCACVTAYMAMNPRTFWTQIGSATLLSFVWLLMLVLTGFFDGTERAYASSLFPLCHGRKTSSGEVNAR